PKNLRPNAASIRNLDGPFETQQWIKTRLFFFCFPPRVLRNLPYPCPSSPPPLKTPQMPPSPKTFFVADLNTKGELHAQTEYAYDTLLQLPGAPDMIGHFSSL